MTPDTARAFLSWVDARKRKVAAMLAGLFPEQRAAAESGAKLKAFLCTRRAGKSWCVGVLLFAVAMLNPGASCLYLGLTRETARAIMNKDVLRVLNRVFDIGAVWNETQRAWVLPNGSVIYLRGADANAYEMSKIVGQKYRLAVLDEAGKFRQDLEQIVYASLVPAMGDDVGTVILAGTPGNVTTGLFHRVTTGQAAGWDVHRWRWQDNVYRRDNIQQIHDALISAEPWRVGTPGYRQEWLGEWVIDTDALVYKFRDDLNTAAELPKPRDEYIYVLGIDFGYTDPTALVVVAYHEHDPNLYVVYAMKQDQMLVDDVERQIRALWWMPREGCRGPYPFAAMVGDGAQLQIVETLAERTHFPIECAEKAGKKGVIDVMNSDLHAGRIKVLPAAMSITEEWNALVWDEKEKAKWPPRWLERAGCANHLSDAVLYAWRKSRNYDARPAAPREPTPHTEAWEALRFEKELAARRRANEVGGHYVDELPPWLGGHDA
jgi:hypothetical protein